MQSKADAKNFKLVELIAQLRDQLDIYRIIGLNVPALRDSDIGGALLEYLQKSAQEALAMYICKIFESPSRNDLNSIPGVIESLPATRLSDAQKREFATFGTKYGNHVSPIEAKSFL